VISKRILDCNGHGLSIYDCIVNESSNKDGDPSLVCNEVEMAGDQPDNDKEAELNGTTEGCRRFTNAFTSSNFIGKVARQLLSMTPI